MSGLVVSDLRPESAQPTHDVEWRTPQASVLLVDDQPGRLLSYEAVLSGLGVRCVRAEGGKEALSHLLSEEFAVILLDVNMPLMDGFEVARMVRGHPRMAHTPIIFVTAATPSELDQLKGYGLGAIDYISVPIVPEILRSKVAVLVELHQRRSELESLNRELGHARALLEQKHANEIAEREAQLKALFEHPAEMTVVLEAVRDAGGAVTDWVYRNANANAQRFLDTPREALIGFRLSAVLPTRWHPIGTVCAQVLANGELLRYEAQEDDRAMLVTVFPMGQDTVVMSALDISDHKRAESALRESEERFRELANNIDQFAWTCDAAGYISWYNDRWYEYTGLTFEDMRHDGWRRLLDDASADRVLGHLRACLAAGEPWEDTFTIRGKDGERRWFLSRAVPIRNADGAVVRWFGTHTDVTEQRQLQEALERADRNKDEFLAMLGHELRNPVAPIATAAEVLSRKVADDEQRALVGVIRRQSAHLAHLLDDLLDVARITQGRVDLHREPVTLASCIDLGVETAAPLVRARGHRLEVTHASEALTVFGDRARLAQCVCNLLTNAAKYTDAGGSIAVAARAENGVAVIEVSDNGAGISAEFLPQIFELFAQGKRGLDRSQGGLGIGLSVCKRLLEMHDGSIAAASAGPGCGSTFTIRLPLSAAAAAPDAVGPAPASGSLNVLVVDDNEDAAWSLSQLLDLEGQRTTRVHTGRDALNVALTLQPDLVLLDIGLPDIDGYEVARELRKAVPRARLVAVTGYGQPEDRERSAAAGFDDHLVKPVDFTALQRTLQGPAQA